MNLIEKTERLLSVCEECLPRLLAMRELEEEPDFFNEVKPYADENHKLVDDWTEEMRTYIRTEKPRYVHIHQVESLNESMKQFIVQSFYAKTGKKRFVLSINSATYTLKTVLEALESERGYSE
ncbi:YppE family protein [Sporosarcina thermotolerans]|uniref:YppE family protein n=1 Tax=Sporosarcina thermotolerans TaxID=633404 RepID=A0AAW9A457_9BACL|nr:YppE family protein [Sporosarcina thermotolerans]MDW0115524.1 YppE family protein [Sporosarcina thermotolerans]WHT47162.1 YppE family protein [Sporosarcina thermotolerans]